MSFDVAADAYDRFMGRRLAYLFVDEPKTSWIGQRIRTDDELLIRKPQYEASLDQQFIVGTNRNVFDVNDCAPKVDAHVWTDS